MGRGIAIAGIGVCLALTAGCTHVQKGTARGGAVGTATGAAVGHYLTTLGGVPGGLIGLGLGTAAGAIATESDYGSEQSDELAAATETMEKLSNEIQAGNAKVGELSDELAKEKAQYVALLEAYEQARSTPPVLHASSPAGNPPPPEPKPVTRTISAEVLFKSGDAKLTNQGKAALRQAAHHVRQNYPDCVIEVRGHTDNEPIRRSSYKSNLALSLARAAAVVQHLAESEGFNARLLTATGCGDTRPVASNDTAEGRRKNRRGELVIWPKGMQVADVIAAR